MSHVGLMRSVRERFHPLYHARRVPLVRAALAGLDRAVWADLAGIDWPVRVRTVRHASYLVRALDSLLTEGVDLLKIDVEGHEERTLNGALRVLERDRPVLLFECFHGDDLAPAMLEALDYELYDAERFIERAEATTNYLAIPSTAHERVSEIREVWRRILDA